MANQIWSQNLPYKMACQLPDCHKPVNRLYQTNIEGITAKFCSPQHAEVGIARWEEKKKLNIKPGATSTNEDLNPMVSDNILDIEEGVK